MSDDDDVKAGDLVQLYPGVWFGGCVATVSEVKPWGVQCYVAIPQQRDQGPGCAFYRAEKGTYKKVGRAVWDVSDYDDPKVKFDKDTP